VRVHVKAGGDVYNYCYFELSPARHGVERNEYTGLNNLGCIR
jgi:hypothetical protein